MVQVNREVKVRVIGSPSGIEAIKKLILEKYPQSYISPLKAEHGTVDCFRLYVSVVISEEARP